MMKYIFFLVCIVSVSVCFSQDYKIIPGEERVYKRDEGNIFKNYLQTDGKLLYVNRRGTSGSDFTEMVHEIEIANASNVSDKIAVFKLEQTNRDLITEVELQRVVFNGKVYVFTSINDLDKQKKCLYVRTVDFDGIPKKDDKVLLLSIDCEKKNMNLFQFGVAFSPDRSKVLITPAFMTLTSLLFDVASLKQIAEMTIPYQPKPVGLEISGLMLCNNGDVICFSPSVKTANAGAPVPAILKFKANEKTPTIINLPAACSRQPECKLTMIGNSVYAYGLCGGKSKTIKDVFYAKLDPGAEKFVSFATILPPAGVSRKIAGQKGAYFQVDKLLVDGDNIFVFCSNSYDVNVVTQNGNFSSSYIEHYNKELIITKFNTTSASEKMYLVPKFTHGYLDNYHTYSKNGEVFLIYAEHPKNLEESTIDKYDAKKYHMIMNYNGSVTVCTKISADGVITRSELFKNKGWCFKPEQFDLILEKEDAIMIHMVRGKKDRFDKVLLK